MGKSKKDGWHGGGHKMHWGHNTKNGCCPYGFIDVHTRWCSQCKMFSICKKYSLHSIKKEKYKQEHDRILFEETKNYEY